MLIEKVLGCGSICRNKRYLLALLAVLALPVFVFMQRFCLKMCPAIFPKRQGTNERSVGVSEAVRTSKES